MQGTIEKGNIVQAKERCSDCHALVGKDTLWWCDEGNCPIEDVSDCKEWEVQDITYEVSCTSCGYKGLAKAALRVYCPKCKNDTGIL